MTAEVAVLNKSAVALAADSKVTISGGFGEKTFDTVNKVFTLSKVHPVGVMIYGNAEFMGYPWETIIKLYRSSKKARSEDTVELWAADFISYVESFGDITPADKSANITEFVSSWFSYIIETALAEAHEKSIAAPSSEFNGVLRLVIGRITRRLKARNSVFSDEYVGALLDAYSSEIDQQITAHFGRHGLDGLKAALAELAKYLLQKDDASPQSGGIVVAGFGDKQIFPAYAARETEGYLGDKIKWVQNRGVTINKKQRSCVAAFAQSDMTQRFMNGIEPTSGSML